MTRIIFVVALGIVTIVTGEMNNGKNLALTDFSETCKKPLVAENYNPNWMKEQGVNENTTIYNPFMTKAYVFHIAQLLYITQEFDSFKEQHLYNTCLRTTETKDDSESGTLYLTKGYDNRNYTYHLHPVEGSPNTFWFPPVFSSNVLNTTFYVSLSDNKSYDLWVVCFEDGLGTFYVDSLQKTLPAETLNIIKEHVKALGFKEEHFVEQNYDRDCENGLIDVPIPKY